MIKRICFWLENSRIFSIPMSILAGGVALTLGFFAGGDWDLGLLAVVGVIFGQLATNLFDDFVDYKLLLDTDGENLKNCQKVKCRYISSGEASLVEVFLVVALYCGIAGSIGLILGYICGWEVLWFALAGIIAIAFYAPLTYLGLGELTVFFIFGPAVFGGIYYVMTRELSPEVFGISIAVGLMTVVLLQTHALLDFDYDQNEGKRTICCMLGDKNKSLNFLMGLIVLAYLSIAILVFGMHSTKWLFLTYLTIPLAIDLYYSVKLYNENKSEIPTIAWYHFPVGKLPQGNEPFQIRLCQARNIMIYFSLLICLAKIFQFVF